MHPRSQTVHPRSQTRHPRSQDGIRAQDMHVCIADAFVCIADALSAIAQKCIRDAGWSGNPKMAIEGTQIADACLHAKMHLRSRMH
jgi:hypothetical protein